MYFKLSQPERHLDERLTCGEREWMDELVMISAVKWR
jgi:hypothetical protein